MRRLIATVLAGLFLGSGVSLVCAPANADRGFDPPLTCEQSLERALITQDAFRVTVTLTSADLVAVTAERDMLRAQVAAESSRANLLEKRLLNRMAEVERLREKLRNQR